MQLIQIPAITYLRISFISIVIRYQLIISILNIKSFFKVIPFNTMIYVWTYETLVLN